ncbi:MAG: zinc ribbon domain-containing protein [Phycisphaerales bacterium]
MIPSKPESILDDLRDERLVLGLVMAGLVTAVALVQVGAMNGPFGGRTMLYLLQGPMVAVYGVVLALCVDPRQGVIPAVLFVLLGASQPVWSLALLILGGSVGTGSDPMAAASMYGGTGLVLAAPVWLSVRRWWAVAAMVGMVLASAWLGAWAPRTLLGLPSQGLAVAALHLGLCWTLTAAAIANTWRIMPSKPAHCPNCGYPREGLRTNVCPECGQRLP